jgi:ABC-2 type transport system ATP-binding protein
VSPVIEAEGLGISFRRNRARNQRLRDVVRGRTKSRKGEFWALRDISFQVGAGEAVGLVGGNGQGKSTLLKLIAGVLLPDEGRLKVHGGVAPLIEVTGGFVGDLTARDNIWLTAGLHGLGRRQIAQRFDEIVDFAEVGDFLDTPFRHFSSGMKVRLGFSVVTTLDEPIVLVDEVLAVGDRAFREKCYGRMNDLLAGGRTLFLVSHNEADLRRFCTRGLYLKAGSLVVDGPLEDALTTYRADVGRRRKKRKAAAAQDPDTGEQRPGDQRPGDQRPGDQRPGEQRPGEQRPGEQRPGEQRPGEPAG